MNRHSNRQLAFLAAVTFLFSGAAQAVTIQDNFDDNSINTSVWRKEQAGGMKVKEKHQRLEITSDVANTNPGGGGLELRNVGINWKKDFELKVDYHFVVAALTGDRQAVVGFTLSFDGNNDPEHFTGVTAGILADVTGLHVGWIEWEDGNVIGSGAKSITATDGELEVEWDKSDDQLKIKAGGKTSKLNGLYSRHGAEFGGDPLVLIVGGGAAFGNVGFTGAQAYLDEFVFIGKTRPR